MGMDAAPMPATVVETGLTLNEKVEARAGTSPETTLVTERSSKAGAQAAKCAVKVVAT